MKLEQPVRGLAERGAAVMGAEGARRVARGERGRFVLPLAAGALVAAALAALLRARDRTFEGRRVLITGGSRGLGLELARELVRRGARVALLARDPAGLQRAADDLQARGGEVLEVACDLSVRTQVEEAVQEVVDAWGGVDVLVNNAGNMLVAPLDHVDPEDLEESLDVHVRGPMVLLRACLPHMRRQGWGRVLNITSFGGVMAVPHMLPYTVGKFAMVGFSDGTRAELAAEGIRVTTVIPGPMRTGSHLNIEIKGRQQQEYAWFAWSIAIPGISMDAGRAARQMVDACASGAPYLVLGLPTRAGMALRSMAPGLYATLAALVHRWILPQPGVGAEGERRRLGRESRSWRAPGVLTTLPDQAAERNLER